MEKKGIPELVRDAVAAIMSSKLTVRFSIGLEEREGHSHHYEKFVFVFEIGLVIPSCDPLIWSL